MNSRKAKFRMAYRPATIEGVHLKAEYMLSCFVFVGGEDGDCDFTPSQLISGFLPPPPRA